MPDLSGLGVISKALSLPVRAEEHVRRALTPERSSGAPVALQGPRQGATGYFSSLAQQFNPLAGPEAWLNLATTLIPGGGRGGRLSPMQQMFLEQLQTNPARANTVRAVGGLAPNTGFSTKVPSVIGKADVQANPFLEVMANRLGFTRGDPLMELLQTQGKNPAERLGMGPGMGVTRATGNTPGIGVYRSGDRPYQGIVSPQVTGGEFGLGNPLPSPSMNTLLQLLNKNSILRRN